VRLLPVLIVLGLAGCAAVETTAERDPAFDLSSPLTYAWMMEQDLGREGGRADEEHLLAVIASSVEGALGARGWGLEEDPARADVLVAFLPDMAPRIAATPLLEYARNPWTWHRFEGNAAGAGIGTLVVDIVDPESRRPVWRGTAKVDLADAGTREGKAAAIAAAVRAMFEGF